jgi:hypothetical protein
MFFCACFLGACSSPRPNEVGVTEEMPAIDVEACLASSSCTKGGASAIGIFLPGDHAIHIPKGVSITAPLLRPASTTAKLRYLVVGGAAEGDYYGTHRLKVSVTGLPDAEISPIGGFTRTELDERGQTPAATNATVTLSTTEGDAFDVLWVEGRWDD